MTLEQIDRIIFNINFAIATLRTCANKDQSLTKSNRKEIEFVQALNALERRRLRAIAMRKNMVKE